MTASGDVDDTRTRDRGFAPTADGGRLYYEVDGGVGDDVPLLLVRPLAGTVELWGRFRAQLAAERCVIVFDARGSGRSSDARFATTTRGMADDACAVLAHLGVARADVFGISLGGMVATWLAADAPTVVRRLVLASTAVRGTAVTREGIGRLATMAQCLLRAAPDAEACLASAVLSQTFRRNAAETARIEALVRAHPSSRMNLVKLIAAAALHDGRAAVGRVRQPTLVLAGAADTVLAPAVQRALVERIAGAIYEEVPDAGHDLTLEAPALAAARVLAFVRGER